MSATPVIQMRDVAACSHRDAERIIVERAEWGVAENEFWVVGAPQHSGKSDFLISPLVHMAAGAPFLGFAPPRAVLRAAGMKTIGVRRNAAPAEHFDQKSIVRDRLYASQKKGVKVNDYYVTRRGFYMDY